MFSRKFFYLSIQIKNFRNFNSKFQILFCYFTEDVHTDVRATTRSRCSAFWHFFWPWLTFTSNFKRPAAGKNGKFPAETDLKFVKTLVGFKQEISLTFIKMLLWMELEIDLTFIKTKVWMELEINLKLKKGFRTSPR